MLIVGIGNSYRGDDGIGPWIVQQLHKIDLPAHIKVKELCGDGAELMEMWRGHSKVIVVDAVQADCDCGELFCIKAHEEQVPGDFFHYSTHAFSVAEAVELSKALQELPAEVNIYGIAGENFAMGGEISDAVRETANKVVELILEDINLTN
ncbi:hydrogenase maturation protease [Candidatus Uabimicrobium amorphum]|uniref:Hydrogenase maturation protease n=1 Tax=Uabimicrobium amorphum TaxID=2596890 RepID=A0A5S9IVG2_UABAM|nr:hydrogenase maturation protease [Candidatus Uabimicrobium amorphum]BBM88251.1 hydrogenase maturation protease [Candidatus Uabimicrobium amorphum]